MGSRGPRLGHTVEQGREPSMYWASGEDPGAVGDLQLPHGIRVQSDDGVVIIIGFFLSSIAVK